MFNLLNLTDEQKDKLLVVVHRFAEEASETLISFRESQAQQATAIERIADAMERELNRVV